MGQFHRLLVTEAADGLLVSERSSWRLEREPDNLPAWSRRQSEMSGLLLLLLLHGSGFIVIYGAVLARGGGCQPMGRCGTRRTIVCPRRAPPAGEPHERRGARKRQRLPADRDRRWPAMICKPGARADHFVVAIVCPPRAAREPERCCDQLRRNLNVEVEPVQS